MSGAEADDGMILTAKMSGILSLTPDVLRVQPAEHKVKSSGWTMTQIKGNGLHGLVSESAQVLPQPDWFWGLAAQSHESAVSSGVSLPLATQASRSHHE